MTRRLDAGSWTVVRLPEHDLAEVILELAAPLLERLGPTPTLEESQGAIGFAVAFWNASVLASKRWDRPRVKELNELRKHMRAGNAKRDDAAVFDRLTELSLTLARS